MKKIIITAANSFIGYRLCREFSQRGDAVFAVIRKGCKNEELLASYKNVRIVYSSMEDYSKLDELIAEKCDTAFLLAWNGTRGKDRANPAMQEENFRWSCECLDSVLKLGVKTVFTAGSQAEYGPRTDFNKVSEEDVCNPNTEYGKQKLAFFRHAEAVCKNNGIRLVEPRFFSLYGDDDTDKTMVVSMIKNMLLNSRCDLTQCVQLWNFLYVDDAIGALIKLCDNMNASGVFNFGSGESKELKEYVERMRELCGSSSVLNFGAVPYPETGIVHTNPCVEKLIKIAEWEPKVSFDCGINKVIDFQKKQ